MNTFAGEELEECAVLEVAREEQVPEGDEAQTVMREHVRQREIGGVCSSRGCQRRTSSRMTSLERVWLEKSEKPDKCAVLAVAREEQVSEGDEAQIVVREHVCQREAGGVCSSLELARENKFQNVFFGAS